MILSIEINKEKVEQLKVYAEILNKTSQPLSAQEYLELMRQVYFPEWIKK